ncbi:MAG: long-chain-acyl-CoA synthetase [Myxococcales bacterium]|nr:long-chain-acyl-CoA synthetase [Myxococcales bacterium]
MVLDYARRLRALLDAGLTNFFWQPTSNTTVALLLERRAASQPDAPFLWFEGREHSIGAVNRAVNEHAHAYAALGLSRGDVVALAMGNRPEYLFHFYGLAKLGVVAALLNPNLEGRALAHAVESCSPRHVVVDDERLPRFGALRRALGESCPWRLWRDDDEPDSDSDTLARELATDFSAALEGQPHHDPPSTAELTLDDVKAYIFTSGTTGLPKAAVVKHHRFLRAGRIMGGITGTTPSDCVYVCLPLYHGNGNIIGTSMAITQGARLALARRFSASRFFDDCRRSGATVAVYIGELCRYLYNQPPSNADRAHAVRVMLGNGLRADIWEPFRQRFGIERIVEFYAATEGNAETANVLGTPGSCGVLLPGKMALARYDIERDELVRDAKGFCKRAAAGEPGLLLGAIEGKNEYSGYKSERATRAKVLSDVFKRGDRWFNSGDLLKRDRLMRLYFVDRLGDTFRWKGENVSTQEVGEQLATHPDVLDCTVYGVAVAGTEGRCGMCALTLRDGGRLGSADALDGAALFAHVSALPAYARPRFVRVVSEVTTTVTFKHRKRELAEEGFDPSRVEEPLYVLDAQGRRYVRLGEAVYADVVAGRWPI